MAVHLYAGRWHEAERLAAELLGADAQRPGLEDLNWSLALLHALRGELDAARASLARMKPWKDSDDDEFRALYASAAVSVRLAEGSAEEALELGWEVLPHALAALGPSNEAVRNAWPATLQAALQLSRVDDASELVALLSKRPPGHIPPYLGIQLCRGRALILAAEGREDAVEAELRDAIAGLRELGYRYWLAVTQTDLSAWLAAKNRRAEASTLLEEAIPTLESLGAKPALDRARDLSRATAATVV
ncbi:MAG: hypothetical protein M3018_14865 [Actinomycetota bacterium]|nr:hypothetical protein [Actinomycetota bacterium]